MDITETMVGTPIILITCEDEVDGVIDESVIVINEKYLSPELPSWQVDEPEEEEEDLEHESESDLGGVTFVNIGGRWYF